MNKHNSINDSVLFGAIQNNEKNNYSDYSRMFGNLDKGGRYKLYKNIEKVKNNKFSVCLVKYSLWKKVAKLV